MGVQLWTVVQDLTQLKDIYRDRWKASSAAPACKCFARRESSQSSEEISKLCGDTTVCSVSNTNGDSVTPGRTFLDPQSTTTSSSSSSSNQSRRARLPQEIRQMPGNRFIMFTDGLPGRFFEPFRKPYWEIPELNGQAGRSAELGRPLYSPDPYHEAKAAREPK